MVAHITGHILVTFKWELADKLSFSIFQEKYDNQIEAHAILCASEHSRDTCIAQRFGELTPLSASFPTISFCQV
jgi:hypothetical protein